MLPTGMELPDGIVLDRHPLRPPHGLILEPEERTEKRDWKWVERVIFASPTQWARIATRQTSTQIARNIRAGRIPAFDPELMTVEAVQIQLDPDLWDIYARANLTPPQENPTQLERDRHMDRIAQKRREWYDKYQLEWLGILAQRETARQVAERQARETKA